MSRIAGTPSVIGKVNYSLIKQTINKNPNITKPMIAQITNLSLVTTSKIVDELVKNHEVICIGYGESTGGRKAMRYTINANFELLLGILIKNQTFILNVMDYGGVVVEHKTVPFDKVDIFSNLCDNITKLLALDNVGKISSIGISIPGTISKGVLSNIPSIPEWENFNLKKNLSNQFKVPIIIENDINVLTIGAHSDYANKKVKNMIFVHMHSGLGAGIIFQNALYKSKNNFAGEIAYMNISSEGNQPESNNIETLLLGLLKNYDENKQQVLDIITKVFANIICVIEPELLIIDSNYLKEIDTTLIKKQLANYIPKQYIPEIVATCVEEETFFRGLHKICFNKTDAIFSIIN